MVPAATPITPTRFPAILATLAASTALGATPGPAFQAIAPGLEYAALTMPHPAGQGESVLHVVRADPAKADLVAYFSTENGNQPLSASEWCEQRKLAVAMNLGMYMSDYRSNVGYARKGAHVNSRRVNNYRSYLVFGPRKPGLPKVDILDAEAPTTKSLLADYEVVVQDLRLIKGRGTTVWKPGTRPWPEAAAAVDDQGRLLFLFSPTAMPMAEFVQRLLALPLGILRAVHADGGPPASLSIHTESLRLDLSGAFETGDEALEAAWQLPLPNILGVAAK
jgi:hypothetical protein